MFCNKIVIYCDLMLDVIVIYCDYDFIRHEIVTQGVRQMSNRETNIREYASQAEGKFLTLLEEVMGKCPELLSQSDKSIAIGHISDMCADMFGECIELASDADSDAHRAAILKHGMSEGRAA